jgi:hypothetical protein
MKANEATTLQKAKKGRCGRKFDAHASVKEGKSCGEKIERHVWRMLFGVFLSGVRFIGQFFS